MHLKKYGIGNLTLSITGLLLNSVTIVNLVRQRRKKPAQLFLVNLCIADILISIFVLISGITPYIQQTFLSSGSDNTFFIIFATGIIFSLCASLSTCWTITFDRLYAISRPLRHAAYYTPKRIKLHISATWLNATIITMFNIVGGSVSIVMIIIRYILSPSLLVTIILLVTMYTKIIRSILKNNRKMAGIAHSNSKAGTNNRTKMNKKLYIHSLVIILNFTICTSPYVTFNILHSPVEHNTQALFMAIGTIGLSAIPVIDSLSYFFLGLAMKGRRDNGSTALRSVPIK